MTDENIKFIDSINVDPIQKTLSPYSHTHTLSDPIENTVVPKKAWQQDDLPRDSLSDKHTHGSGKDILRGKLLQQTQI